MRDDVTDNGRDERPRPLPPIGPLGRCIVGTLHFVRRRWWQVLGGGVAALAFLVVGTEYATSRPAFCGSCHSVMAPYYKSWKRDVHSAEGVICVDCHYAPGQQHTLQAKLRGLSQLVTYAAGAIGGGRLRGHVPSESCTTEECHPSGTFEEKSYLFPKPPEGVSAEETPDGAPHSLRPFTHQKHLGKLANGQELQCATCHEHRAGEVHMITFAESCYLCHFNKKLFNTDRARCLLCHKLPLKPIEDADKDPITHQVMVDRRVACASCHTDVVRGGGPVYKERCRACHDQPGLLAAWELVKPHRHATKAETEECAECQKALRSKIRMHQNHVKTQAANCFDCHVEIQHGVSESGLEVVRSDCAACHGESHQATVALLEGRVGLDPESKVLEPHTMFPAHTVCTGCHTEEGTDCMKQPVSRAGNASCASCHGTDHAVFETWKQTVSKAQSEAETLQKEAQEALREARESGRLAGEDLRRLEDAIQKADRRLRFVKQAGPMHNQKLAVRLLDDAMYAYEDAVDDIKKATERTGE